MICRIVIFFCITRAFPGRQIYFIYIFWFAPLHYSGTHSLEYGFSFDFFSF